MNLPIIKKRKIADDTYEVTFELKDEKFSFEAGQYVQIVLPDNSVADSLGISRDFSLVNSPHVSTELVIAFRNSESGFKKLLVDAPIGTFVEIDGPFGTFTLPKNNKTPLIFIAGGIGITPFVSMIRFVTGWKLKNKILLLYANRDKKSAAYLKELKEIEKENPDITVINIFGRLTKSDLAKYLPTNTRAKIYIAGPPKMVEYTKKLAVTIGISEHYIHTEEFTGERDV